MVGRDAETALVHGLVDGVDDGRGGVLLVLGEAGIGKTRLLAEAARHARGRGLAVLTGRAVQSGGAYRPLAEALARHLGDEPDDPGLRPYRAALGRILPGWSGGPPAGPDPVLLLGEGIARLLGGRGTVLVLEDLHWADADTRAVLEYLAGALRDRPVLVVGSARDDEDPPRLAGARTVRLRRLDGPRALELARRCAGGDLPAPVRELVLGKSDGLPLLVEELVAGGRAPTLAALVAERLAALSPDGRRILQAAAVLGGDPDWTLLGAVTGAAEDAVLAALRAAQPRLVVTEGEALRWRHALTRDAVLASLTAPERAVLARRSADALLARGGPDDAERAAGLLAAAGERDRAAAVFLRLARAGLVRGALHDAAALLDRAGAGPEVAVERVRLLTLRGHADEALAEGSRVLDATTGADHARLCVRLADAAIALRRWEEADRLLHRAGRPDDPGVLVLAADAAFGPGDLPRAARLATAAIAAAEARGRVEECCRALVILGRCVLREDPAAARSVYERALQLAAEHGLRPWRITALIQLGTIEVCAHPFSPLLAEARELALDTGRLAEAVVAGLLHAEGLLLADGPAAAEGPAREGVALADRLRMPALAAMGELLAAHARALAGDRDGAAALLASAAGRADAAVEIAALPPVVRGLSALLDGDLDAAAPLFDEGLGLLHGRRQAAPVPHWGLWALLRTLAGDRGDEAREQVRNSYVTLRAVNAGALRYADAVAAGRAGRPAEAAGLFAEGDALLAEHHWWRRLCRTLALRAAVADGWGRPVPALRADLAAFEASREERLARLARDLLRKAGAPTRRGRGHRAVPALLRAAGVTSRETDVLGLVAEGLTNRQIADRLYLSPRTVDTHVASLLAKTGAADRHELRRVERTSRRSPGAGR
ncbi:ATP-binding protein [Actinomadura parmotrematis]|nr:LuxR family transcriptional regulator [Actinomadura parmotrematis]